jgi:hypothetical protein
MGRDFLMATKGSTADMAVKLQLNLKIHLVRLSFILQNLSPVFNRVFKKVSDNFSMYEFS